MVGVETRKKIFVNYRDRGAIFGKKIKSKESRKD